MKRAINGSYGLGTLVTEGAVLKSDIEKHNNHCPPKFEIARGIPQLKISF